MIDFREYSNPDKELEELLLSEEKKGGGFTDALIKGLAIKFQSQILKHASEVISDLEATSAEKNLASMGAKIASLISLGIANNTNNRTVLSKGVAAISLRGI